MGAPLFFKKLDRGFQSFGKKIERGGNKFFTKTVPGAARTVGRGIEKAAKVVGNGIEKAVKSPILQNVLAGAGLALAPFSAGTSLSLESAAAGLAVANDARKKVGSVRRGVNNIGATGKQAMRNSITNINQAAQRGISTQSGRAIEALKQMSQPSMGASSNAVSMH